MKTRAQLGLVQSSACRPCQIRFLIRSLNGLKRILRPQWKSEFDWIWAISPIRFVVTCCVYQVSHYKCLSLCLSVLFQSFSESLHDLLQLAHPESDGSKRAREASDSALLLSTTKVLDDILNTNSFTFPVGMRKQPPVYHNVPTLVTESLPTSGKKRKRSDKRKRHSAEVRSFF